MRILVTGITGQVGSALLRSLRPYGELLPADRAVLDLSKPAELVSRLESLRPDVIVNAAAYTAVDRAEDERDLAFIVNGESPGEIARWAAVHRTPLIHFSTDYVFDGTGTRPWREDDPTGPLSAYGASKLIGEQMIRRAGGPHLIARTSWVYAAQGANFLRTIAKLAAEREELRIVADQVGAPTPAAWIGEVVSRIFAREFFDLAGAFKKVGHNINMAAAGETSWHGFAQAIVTGLKRRGQAVKASVAPIESKDYPVRATRPKNSRLDLSRLSTAFQIEPPGWDVLLERELDLLAATLKT